MSKRPAPLLAVRKEFFELAVKRGSLNDFTTGNTPPPTSGSAPVRQTIPVKRTTAPVVPEAQLDQAKTAPAAARRSQRRARNPRAPSPVGQSSPPLVPAQSPLPKGVKHARAKESAQDSASAQAPGLPKVAAAHTARPWNPDAQVFVHPSAPASS
jgi:hypothetical protein